jgi:hypothetical protein
MTEPKDIGIVHGELVPSESREAAVRMPHDTPLGLGFLGAMRFAAIRRVLEYREQALRAAIINNDAEAEHNNSLVRRAVSHQQLLNLDIIRGAETQRILTAAECVREEAEIARLQRTVEKLELQTKIAQKEDQLERAKARYGKNEQDEPKDDYSELLDEIRRMPQIADTVVKVKADILKKFGVETEDELGEQGKQLIESLNSLVNATILKRSESRVL